MKKTFYITTPLYYVNASPHIGHSYTQIVCDCIARYKRLKGEKVFFLTGTDEHGQKVYRSAEKAGKQTQEFADGVVERFKQLWKRLDISYDDFIRTTEARHIKAVQKALKALYDKGDIYEDVYSGYYCVPCETFWQKPQLKDNLCPDCGRAVEYLEEKSYFFRLSKYQDWLLKYIENNPDFVKPDFRKNEVLGLLKQPLSDLCISRPRKRLSWGIDMPFSKEHVVYVWIDALLNYISAPGFAGKPDKFKQIWPADVHIMAKDILRFHAVYWPIIIHALGLKPPRCVFAHGWWVMAGEKMSKSKGNIVDPNPIIEEYGADALRYFLLREVTLGLDGNFSEGSFINRYNGDLANDLGNLLNRTLTMVHKYFKGKIPSSGRTTDNEQKLLDLRNSTIKETCRHMEQLSINKALVEIWCLVNAANKHIEDSAPWNIAKEGDTERLSGFLLTLLRVLEIVAVLIYPHMPSTSKKMAGQLNIKEDIEKTAKTVLKKGFIIKAGHAVSKPVPLFPRIQK